MPPVSSAAVADQHGARPDRRGRPAVDGQVRLEPLDEQVLEAGGHVGGPADLGLELLGGVLHDRGVETEAGHDEERVPSRPDRRALADVLLEVGLVGVQPHPADVDVPVAAGDRDHHGAREVVGRQLEVAGEQVAGAAGEQPHRHAGADHLLGHGTHGAVATERAHDVDVLGEGLSGLAEPDVVLRRLDEERLVPALLCAHAGDHPLHVDALELGGVEHHGQSLAWGSGGVVDGAEAVAGRAAGRLLTIATGRDQQPQPGDDECDGDGDAHIGPPGVRHSVEGTAR